MGSINEVHFKVNSVPSPKSRARTRAISGSFETAAVRKGEAGDLVLDKKILSLNQKGGLEKDVKGALWCSSF